jgi:hypothetical protein
MPAGPITEHPVTKFPSIKAVGAKRRAVCAAAGLCMQMHLGEIGGQGKHGIEVFSMRRRLTLSCSVSSEIKGVRQNHWAGIFGLRDSNPLLYRCFPLTCARSQE